MMRLIALVVACCAALSDVATAQTLDRIATTKTVRIGFIADQAPFASKGDSGAPVGYAIDVCGRVVEEIGHRIGDVKPAYIETTLADAFAAIAADRIDLLCGAITVTLGRRETVDFSQPIFLTGASGLLRTDSPRDLRELFLGERTISPPRSPELRPFATSRVGVRAATTTEAILRRRVAEEGYGAEIIGFETHAEGLAALEARRIDAYVGDRVLLIGLLGAARDPSGLIVGSRLFTRELYGIAMMRGDADLRLLADRALSQFYATREFTELLVKYFGEQAPAIQAQILAQSASE
jgi:polar amino acid transport system substrate-binding protein